MNYQSSLIIDCFVCNLFYRKGISQSALPYRRGVPTWLKQTPEDVKDQIYLLAKKGLMPSKIGKLPTNQPF